MKGDQIKSNSVQPSVFLDALTIHAVKMLLFRRPGAPVHLLGALDRRRDLWRRGLSAIGIVVRERHFFLGNMFREGESLYHLANHLSRATAIKAAAHLVERVPELRALDKESGRKTIELYAVKVLRPYLRAQILNVLAARHLANGTPLTVWLERPVWYDSQWILDLFPDVEIRFYSAPRVSMRVLFPSIRSFALRRVRRRLASGYAIPDVATRSVPSVLMLQEDTIRADHSLRGQPHWTDLTRSGERYNSYILRAADVFSVADDAKALSDAGIFPIAASCLSIALKEVGDNPALARVKRNREKVFRAFRKASAGPDARMLLKVGGLLEDAQLIAALCLWLNARCFLVRETYYSFADAMQLVAEDVGVTTIAYQYSNLGNVSPNLLTTADTLVTFSALYQSVFEAGNIRPAKVVSAGYPYNGVRQQVASRSREHRRMLNARGATFVLCYFDESVQYDKWGLVNREAHLAELHHLARAILEDADLGLVVKSQFMKNSPSQLYPEDVLLREAKATGRYLELLQGFHRNDVYPTEAALAADLCIAHKFGATAALESAVAGVRTVMLDSYGTRTHWDSIYSRADIEYQSMSDVIAAIRDHRAGNPDRAALGDWSGIIGEFDPFRDGTASDRLRGLVEHAIESSARATPHTSTAGGFSA